jgi:hypothetical protein
MPDEIPNRHGSWRKVGDRRTYFPPFVDERFLAGAGSFWSCTFASLLNGANVAFLGKLTPTHGEIRRLADISGDPDLFTGANTDQMITAFTRKYKRPLGRRNLDEKGGAAALATGHALVAFIIPRNYDSRFWHGINANTEGHRIVAVGLDDKNQTRVLDPMVAAPRDYPGEAVPWSTLYRAMVKDQQVWFKEGQYRSAPTIAFRRRFRPSRRFIVEPGTRVVAFNANQPTVIADRATFMSKSAARFDALVYVRVGKEPVGPFLRVVSGHFQGLLIKPGAAGIRANVDIDANTIDTPVVGAK